MSDISQLRDQLRLQPVEADSLTFGEFLARLKDKPEMADTAAALMIRAIEKRGEIDIESVPKERQPYLRMLKKMRIVSWKAFDKVKGSQRTVARVMNNLRQAAANGYQLRLAFIFKGGPGSGKSFLVEAIKSTLEGEVIYSVADCPVHENPINLLNLILPKEEPERQDAIEKLARQLHLDESAQAGKPSLRDLLATAGEPCQKCWSKIMEGDNKANPNLFDVEIKGLRLSSRKFGIATWTMQEPLLSTLSHGSRGIVDMPELFSSASPMAMGALSVLLDATNDRRIPAAGNKMPAEAQLDSQPGWLPLDAVLIGQTNDGAWERFIASQPDPNKFTRRMQILNVPYITSVTEEELAYRDFLAGMRDRPHFGPMALKLAALLSVISRMKKDHEVDIVTRARMYDGEQLIVEKKDKPAATTYGYYGQAGNSTSKKAEVEHWSVGEFWAEAGEDEGLNGLNMAVMLGIISQITELALKDKDRCVSELEMINFLRASLAQLAKTPGLTDKEKEIYKNCEEFLKGPKSFDDKAVGLIEAEYRRVLRRQLFEVAAPDFERRANELFSRYRAHAKAFSTGFAEVEETVIQAGVRTLRKEKVDEAFLNDLDKWMALSGSTEKNDFRRSIDAEIGVILESRLKQNIEAGIDAEVDINWQTVPRLGEGIAKKLNEETAKRLEVVLKSEIELNDEEKAQRRDALQRFDKLGYCRHCQKQALAYFRDYKLWNQS
jgi:serine protein kinase